MITTTPTHLSERVQSLLVHTKQNSGNESGNLKDELNDAIKMLKQAKLRLARADQWVQRAQQEVNSVKPSGSKIELLLALQDRQIAQAQIRDAHNRALVSARKVRSARQL